MAFCVFSFLFFFHGEIKQEPGGTTAGLMVDSGAFIWYELVFCFGFIITLGSLHARYRNIH